jgi:hypothetical protein
MHTFQLDSHIRESSILSVKLSKEWAEKDVSAEQLGRYEIQIFLKMTN